LKLHALRIPTLILNPLDHPGDRVTESLSKHRHTGLAYGRQTFLCPLTRTALPQLTHQHTVRQEDQIHVAGLATALPELTIAHAQMLLAVPMEALGPSPATTINFQYPRHLPMGAIADENLFDFGIFSFGPEEGDTHLMVHMGKSNRFGEIVLPRTIEHERLAVVRSDLTCQFFSFEFPALKEDLAIELQVSHIGPVDHVEVIEVFDAGEVAVESKSAGDLFFHDPVDKPSDELVMIDKLNISLAASLFFNEPIELQGIMFTGGTDVVGDDIIVSDFVATFGMIPEVADVLNRFAIMVDQDIINGDDPLGAIAGVRLLLQPIESLLVERFFVPIHFGQPAIETGLVGHDRILHDSVTLPAINRYRQNTHLESNISILQKFSYYLNPRLHLYKHFTNI